MLARPENTYDKLINLYPQDIKDYGNDTNEQIELEIKYEGYISRQMKEAKKFEELDKIKIPINFSYEKVIGLRSEAKQKLTKFRPHNLAAASKIDGVLFGDISILIVALQNKKHLQSENKKSIIFYG